jgi:hypothetical protein
MRRKTTVSFLFFRERKRERNEGKKKEQKPSQKELQAFKVKKGNFFQLSKEKKTDQTRERKKKLLQKKT